MLPNTPSPTISTLVPIVTGDLLDVFDTMSGKHLPYIVVYNGIPPYSAEFFELYMGFSIFTLMTVTPSEMSASKQLMCSQKKD